MKATNLSIACLIALFIFTYLPVVEAQEITQTVKGRIVDRDTKIPLPGATIVLLNTDPLLGGTTDIDGYYRIEKVPIKRYNLQFTYMGFEPVIISEVLVGSGKEVVVNVGMKESLVDLEEVVIKAKIDKKKPINNMALLSSRQINMEEARRFAGAFDDPARLVTSYAGVASGNMSSNGIIVRGNAPKGVLWRLEGLEIANPSHFANLTTFGGGGISSLSSQMIDNSDFYTAAFPAQFGNALSGVFDLRLRSGNRDKREHAFQAGITGIDVSSEGPFKKGKPATYLFNYRYSMFGLIQPILPDDAGQITYQDVAFKTDFPTKKAGNFSIWGLGSTDRSGSEVTIEPEDWVYEDNRREEDSRTAMGAFGLSHKIIIGDRSMLHTSLALTGSSLKSDGGLMDTNKVVYRDWYFRSAKWSNIISSSLNHKFSARHANQTGITYKQMNFDVLSQDDFDSMTNLITIADDEGTSSLIQAFSQSRYDISEKLTVNAGVHIQYFQLNGNFSTEPRLALRYGLSQTQAVTLGYGKHSRLNMLFVYLTQHETEDGPIQPNRDLDFTKAHHFVAGYEHALGNNMNFKSEVYYQHLYDVPVEEGTSFSLLNVDSDWDYMQALANKGTADNYGVDLTLERFMQQGYYYVITASVFDAKYVGGDGIERNARFNKNFVFNLVGGKEWQVGRGHKNNSLGINGKFSVTGGDRQTPVNQEASFAQRNIIYNEERAFAEQWPTVYYLHFTLNYTKNKEKHASIWSFQVLNALGAGEYFGYRFNHADNVIEEDGQTLVIPNISYKIVF